VLFGLKPSGEQVSLNTSDHTVRSLWFEAGKFYTLNGSGTIKLNSGTTTGHVLVVTNNATAPKQSETNIESAIQLESIGNRALIENWSEGGLRIGGLFKSNDFSVQFGGTGAIHIANRITNQDGNRGNSNFYIQGSTGTEENVHLILSGNNDQTFGGVLQVNDRGFLIVKENQALGEGSNKIVNLGGTIGLRSHLEKNLTYEKPGQNNYVGLYGDGIVRISGTTKRIGALYNDGGWNSFEMRMDQTTPETRPTGFGSRGDREGGLELRNQVRLTTEFHKLGPGLIVLNNQYGGGDANQWDKDTHLKAGVLRIANANSLPSASNLVFDGGFFGGILELGYGTTFNYSLGTGGGNLRWKGDGGFSAFGGARSITISGGTLTWGSTANFIGNGHALLLSSRYANDVITFTNNIDLNGQTREVRVERGEDTAHAVLSGVLSGTGGLLKTGDGLLELTGVNAYTGATRIEAGVLLDQVNPVSNIQLAGGLLGLDIAFTRGLGEGTNQIQWVGHGGFAAYSQGYVAVDLGNSVTWGDAHFVQDGDELRFGHYTALGMIDWQTQLNLGSGNRTIRLERGKQLSELADVTFSKGLSGTGTLNLLGNGRFDLRVENPNLELAALNIRGAELWLRADGFTIPETIGKISGAATAITLSHGGTLRLGDPSGEASWNTNAPNRIHNDSTITLAAGTLILSDYFANNTLFEKVGSLTLESGANTIELARVNTSAAANLHVEELLRDDDSRATLTITGDLNDSLINLKVEQDASVHGINDEIGGIKIIPWATSVDEWAHVVGNALKALATTDYHTGNQSTWTSAALNVKTSGDTLSANRTINSLILSGNLNLGTRTLTLNSGGLMSIGIRQILSTSNSAITTASGRPLYIHNASNLLIGGRAIIAGGMDVVKTRSGSLVLNSSRNHVIGSLYIHQGTVELRGTNSGNLQIADRITIGDGAGTDKLILPGGRWNPIIKQGGGLPSITLRGTPYDPRGPEYGGDQAILQLGGNGPYGAGTKQRLANLHIEGRGTIDWRGGEVGLANILWIDSLSFSSTSDRLFIRNWYEYEDLFLVRREGFHTDLLPQIIFEGYQDYETTWKPYDDTYIQITPFGKGGYLPEPSTYGAILGAVGIGLWTWRKTQRPGLRRNATPKMGTVTDRSLPKAG